MEIVNKDDLQQCFQSSPRTFHPAIRCPPAISRVRMPASGGPPSRGWNDTRPTEPPPPPPPPAPPTATAMVCRGGDSSCGLGEGCECADVSIGMASPPGGCRQPAPGNGGPTLPAAPVASAGELQLALSQPKTELAAVVRELAGGRELPGGRLPPGMMDMGSSELPTEPTAEGSGMGMARPPGAARAPAPVKAVGVAMLPGASGAPIGAIGTLWAGQAAWIRTAA